MITYSNKKGRDLYTNKLSNMIGVDIIEDLE